MHRANRENPGTAAGLSIILGAVAFFVGAAVWGYDPGEVLPMLLFIPLFAVLGAAALMYAVSVVISLAGWLSGGHGR